MPPAHRNSRYASEWQDRPHSVGPIVPPESIERSARIVVDVHLRRQQDFSARAPQPAAELDVLAAFQALVKPADPVEHFSFPARPKYGIHPAGSFQAISRAGAKMGVPHSKQMR